MDNVFYINLEYRVDRKKHMKQELKKLGWKGKRIEAVQMKDGSIGCTLSHIKCLKMAIEKDLDYIIILEDDIEFLNPPLFLQNFHKFLHSGMDWDVILICGNNAKPCKQIEEYYAKINNTQTTTGYMVKKHYFSTLLNNMKEGLQRLMREPDQHFYYAIDKFWFHLQEQDNWFLILPLTVTQMEGYSDIEKKETNYSHNILLLNKPYFIYL